MPAFGRLLAHDARDASFPMMALLPAAPSPRRYRYWNANGAWLDQGEEPHCVGYAWVHWLEDGPVSQPGVAPIVNPSALYDEAQRLDEWEGENYDGTSVRAGVKALFGRGFIRSYHWASSVQEIVQALLEVGPVVMGTNWYMGMLSTDEAGFLRVAGGLVGGHAYVLNGVNVEAGIVRIKNSWSRAWGTNGHALLTIADLATLLADEGEACLAVEIRQ